MKELTIIIMLIGCLASSILAASPKMALGNDSKKINLITKLYKEFYEKRDTQQMGKFFSKNVSFQANFNVPINYESLKDHLVKINQECRILKMLPFDEILVANNRVITLYTQSCTDKLNIIHKKRIMAITEIDEDNRISKIQAVTKKEDES